LAQGECYHCAPTFPYLDPLPAAVPADWTSSSMSSRMDAGMAHHDDLEKVSLNTKAAPEYGCVSEKPISGKPAEDDDKLLAEPVNGRFPYLDIIRVMCIFLVSVDHGGTTFGQWNTMFVQGWVLQYLFLICGISYGLTSRNLMHYLTRLMAYFVIGVCVNWFAWAVKGKDWKGDAWNVVFQFWFVLGLMVFLSLLTPLKRYLESIRRQAGQAAARATEVSTSEESPTSAARTLVAVFGGLVGIRVIFIMALIPAVQITCSRPLSEFTGGFGPGAAYWGLPQTPVEAQDFLEAIMSYFQLSASSLYLIVVFPMVSQQHGLVGWLVLLNTYGHRVIQYRSQFARMINGFDLTMIGLACYYLGLKHRRVVGEYLVRYWFLTLFGLSVLWPPGTFGRFDENPPKDLPSRIRDNLLEMIMVVIFLCAMERLVDSKIFTVDNMEWLGDWALLVFLVHKAIHIIFPPPFNWLMLLGSVPMVYILRGRKKAKASE